MNGPSCEAPNRESAKFCLGCGHAFTLSCSACGTELPPAARFCDECGAGVAGAAEGASASASSERAPRDYTGYSSQVAMKLKR